VHFAYFAYFVCVFYWKLDASYNDAAEKLRREMEQEEQRKKDEESKEKERKRQEDLARQQREQEKERLRMEKEKQDQMRQQQVCFFFFVNYFENMGFLVVVCCFVLFCFRYLTRICLFQNM
jgi:hypothetical protein